MQQDYPNVVKAGLGLATISYDSPATLKRFAVAHHVTYPMLSDSGSKVIRAYGILNVNIPPSATKFYGIPFPGQYLIAPDGVVRDEQFLPDFRERPTASEVLLEDFGDGGQAAAIKAGDLSARVRLSSARTFAGHQLGVIVDFDVKPPWHVYGEPLPRNYVVTRVTFGGPIAGQKLDFPKAKPVMFLSLGEVLPVYTGKFAAKGTILLRRDLTPGSHPVTGTLSFQECNNKICKLPRTVSFALPLTIEPPVKPLAP